MMCSPGFRTTVSVAQEHINLCRWSEPAQNIIVPCQFTTGALCKPQGSSEVQPVLPPFPQTPSHPINRGVCSIAVKCHKLVLLEMKPWVVKKRQL